MDVKEQAVISLRLRCTALHLTGKRDPSEHDLVYAQKGVTSKGGKAEKIVTEPVRSCLCVARSRPYSCRPASKWGPGENRLAAAVVGGRADTLALTDLYVGLGVVGCGGAHALLDLAGHGQESLLDVAGVLCRSLEEWNAQAVGKFLRTVLVDLKPRGGCM